MTNRQLIAAYWCYEISPKRGDRFYWSIDEQSRLIDEGGAACLQILLAIAMTAPSEWGEALFAAGPLEDYVNRAVERQAADEAAFVVGNGYFKRLLPSVWGQIEAFNVLAKQGDPTKAYVGSLDMAGGLKHIDDVTVVRFWCYLCDSSDTDEYRQGYDAVCGQLASKKTRNVRLHALELLAPDNEALERLHELTNA